MAQSLTRVIAAVLTASSVVACGGSRAASVESRAPEPVRILGDSAAIANARPDATRYPYTEADVHFISGMIGHHAQAITMARMAESHTTSSSIRTLAGRVINAQQDEIALMQQWLEDRGQPVPEPTRTGVKMTMHGSTHEMNMPGMLTEAQLKQLDAARGKQFDELFLTFMIQHHQGAVTMVKELFSTRGAGLDETVFKLASDVNVDQTTEIRRMQQMLFALKLEGYK
jgi:uncharacterized protein (DUF305 family)